MKNQTPIRTMDTLLDAMSAFRLPQVLATALDFDIFTCMGNRFWTPKTLATTLNANTRGVEILLRNLETVGLLKKRGVAFGVGEFGRTRLNRQSPSYQGEYLDLLRHQLNNWGELTSIVRTGQPLEQYGPGDPDSLRSFTWAMHQRSLQPAKEVAATLNFKHVNSVLDVGGGPGTYALAFLAKHPKLQAGIWDREPALDVARTIAAPLRHGKRLSYYPGDFFNNPVPGKFDVCWVSNVVHMFSAADNKRLFRKLARALNPGGRLLIQDTFLMNAPGFNTLATNLFAVTMLLYTPAGNTYSAKEVQQWLQACGLKRTRCLHMTKGTGDWDGVIIEATQS